GAVVGRFEVGDVDAVAALAPVVDFVAFGDGAVCLFVGVGVGADGAAVDVERAVELAELAGVVGAFAAGSAGPYVAGAGCSAVEADGPVGVDAGGESHGGGGSGGHGSTSGGMYGRSVATERCLSRQKDSARGWVVGCCVGGGARRPFAGRSRGGWR